MAHGEFVALRPELLATGVVDDQTTVQSKMPLYHIQVVKGRRTVDPRAIDLPDSDTAKHHAGCLARSLTALRSKFSVDHLHDWHVRLTDKNGKTLGLYEIAKLPTGGTPGRSDVQRRLRA
jgi:hypothetical protein